MDDPVSRWHPGLIKARTGNVFDAAAPSNTRQLLPLGSCISMLKTKEVRSCDSDHVIVDEVRFKSYSECHRCPLPLTYIHKDIHRQDVCVKDNNSRHADPQQSVKLRGFEAKKRASNKAKAFRRPNQVSVVRT